MNFYALSFLLVWIILLLYLMVRYKFNLKIFLAIAVLLTIILLAFIWTFPHVSNPQMASRHLPKIVLVAHALFSFLSFGAFVLAFCAAIFYLIQERLLKIKNILSLSRNFPSLEGLEDISFKFILIGFPLLTLGIIGGAIWSKLAHGYYFAFHLKETWSFLTWIIYGGYLSIRYLAGWSRHRRIYLLIIGSAIVVVSYFVIPFLVRTVV